MAKGKKKKKKKGARGRAIALIVFLLAAGALVWGRHELLWGARAYLLGEIDYFRLTGQADLPSPSKSGPQPAEALGIPDYKNALRFPHEGETLTCYRMVDFGNRLVVCSGQGLKRPEAIQDIIQNRSITGTLESLKKSSLDLPLRRVFQKEGGIRLREDAFLLLEDRLPVPPPVRLGILAFCMILCCLSAYKLIKP